MERHNISKEEYKESEAYLTLSYLTRWRREGILEVLEKHELIKFETAREVALRTVDLIHKKRKNKDSLRCNNMLGYLGYGSCCTGYINFVCKNPNDLETHLNRKIDAVNYGIRDELEDWKEEGFDSADEDEFGTFSDDNSYSGENEGQPPVKKRWSPPVPDPDDVVVYEPEDEPISPNPYNMDRNKFVRASVIMKMFSKEGAYYSFCRHEPLQRMHDSHCIICGYCRDWHHWHCHECDNCSYGQSIPKCEHCGDGDGDSDYDIYM